MLRLDPDQAEDPAPMESTRPNEWGLQSVARPSPSPLPVEGRRPDGGSRPDGLVDTLWGIARRHKWLIAFVTASFRPPIADAKLLATWLAFWSLVKTDPAVAAIHRETYGGYRADLEALLRGCALDAAAARPAAIALTALVDGLWLELSLDPTTFTPEEAAAMAVRWLDALLEPTC